MQRQYYYCNYIDGFGFLEIDLFIVVITPLVVFQVDNVGNILSKDTDSIIWKDYLGMKNNKRLEVGK